MRRLVVLPLLENYEIHYLKSTLCGYYLYNLDLHVDCVVGLSLLDILPTSDFKFETEDILYTFNKKLLDFHLNSSSSIDINLLLWNSGKSLVRISDHPIIKFFKFFYKTHVNYGKFIPYTRYLEIGRSLCTNDLTKSLMQISTDNTFYQDVVYPVVTTLERTGLKINLDEFNKTFDKNYTESLIYTYYNLFTSTGRISNSFDTINFAALNKYDGSRNCIISRYDDGYLVELDIDACHLRLISFLVGYNFPINESVHTYFAKKYFNVSSIDESLYNKAKEKTFQLLYGESKSSDLEFFKLVQKLKETIFTLYTQGNLYTPISKKRFKIFSEDVGQSKVFNYYIQNFEMEFCMKLMKTILEVNSNYLILYTYDAFLFDVPKKSSTQFFSRVLSIFKSNNLLVKVKVGKTYDTLKRLNLIL